MLEDVSSQDDLSTAPPFGVLRPAIVHAMSTAKHHIDIGFTDWPKLLDLSYPTFRALIEGSADASNRARATFKALSACARLAAILDVRAQSVCDHPLPPVSRQMLLEDLARLRALKDNKFLAAFCDRRVREIEAGDVIQRPNAFVHPDNVMLDRPRTKGDV